MSDSNDFKGRASAFATKAAEKAKNLAAAAADKTRQLSRIAKLNMDIVGQRDTIKKAYAELGRLYYEAHHEMPEDPLAQICQEVDLANESIAAMEDEIARLKTGLAPEEAQDGNFEAVVDETEADIEVEIQVEEDMPAPAGTEFTAAEVEPVPAVEPIGDQDVGMPIVEAVETIIDIPAAEPAREEEVSIAAEEPVPEEDVSAAAEEPVPEKDMPAATEEPVPEEDMPVATEEPVPEEDMPAAAEEPVPEVPPSVAEGCVPEL